MKTLIISLGGSIIVPEELDIIFLKKFRELILKFVGRGNRFVIVTGGGRTNKKYNEAAKKIAKIKNEDLDWLGIAATKLNAELVRTIFGAAAYGQVVVNPTEKIKTAKKIIIAAGWQPGSSTDKDAVLWAKNLGTKTVVNLTNVAYVYNQNPLKFKNARPIKKLSWQEYKKLIGGKWVPRMHSPFDPVASRLAEGLGIRVVIMQGTDLGNFRRFLEGKDFKGSVVR